MTTKLTLLALCAVSAFAVSPPVEKPGDAPTIVTETRLSTGMFTTAATKGTLVTMSAAEAAQQAGLIFITKQEAANVVKALEMFMPPDKRKTRPVYNGDGTINKWLVYVEPEPPDMRDESQKLRAEADRIEQRDKDLAWARAVLETWRGKVKEAGK